MPVETFGPNDPFVLELLEAGDGPAPLLLARTSPAGAPFPAVPPPEPPATASTMLTTMTGREARMIDLRRRLSAATTGGRSFRGIPSPPKMDAGFFTAYALRLYTASAE